MKFKEENSFEGPLVLCDKLQRRKMIGFEFVNAKQT